MPTAQRSLPPLATTKTPPKHRHPSVHSESSATNQVRLKARRRPVRAGRHSGHLPGEALLLTRAFVLSAQPLELLGIQAHTEREAHRPKDRRDLVERFLAEVLRLEQLGLGPGHELGDGPDVR